MHSKARILSSALLLVTGLVIELAVIDIISIDENLVHAPNWVIALVGILFLSGGLAVVVSPESYIATWSAGTLVIAITLVSAWVTAYGSSEHFSGDWPFVSQDTNVIIARIMFGCVSLLGVAIILAAAKKSWGRGDA